MAARRCSPSWRCSPWRLVAPLSLATHGSRPPSARDDRRTAVLAAARQEAVNFTTLDYRHLDRDLGRVLHGSTGDFRKQFRAGTKDLTTLVTAEQGGLARARCSTPASSSTTPDSARVLVVADSTVTNAAEPQAGRSGTTGCSWTWSASGGRWLVSDLQFVG